MANRYESFTLNISGLDEIERRLQQLPEKLRRKAIRKALTNGSDLVKEEAIRMVPRRKPARGWMAFMEQDTARPKLRDNIVSKISIMGISASARVGIDYTECRHGHLVEFGTDPHDIKFKTKEGRERMVRHPGSHKQPFMRPAFDNKGDEAVNVMITQLAQAVEKEV